MDYTVPTVIANLHAIPRIQGTSTLPVFSDATTDYFVGAGFFPAVFLLLGLLSIVIWPLCICCCSKGAGHDKHSLKRTLSDRATPRSKCGEAVLRGGYILLTLVLVGSCAYGYSANGDAGAGIDKVLDAVDAMSTLLQQGASNGDQFVTLATASAASLAAVKTHCPNVGSSAQFSEFEGFIEQAKTKGESFQSSFTGPARDFTADMSSVSEDGRDYNSKRSTGTTVVLVLASALALLYLLSLVFALTHAMSNVSRVIVPWVWPLSLITIFVLFTLVGVQLAFSTIGADLCVDPNAGLQRQLEVGSETRDILAFYSTCTGTNPLDTTFLAEAKAQIAQAQAGRADLATALQAEVDSGASAGCTAADVQAANELAGPLASASALTDSTAALVDCETSLNAVYGKLVYEGVCEDTVVSIAHLFAAMAAAAFSLVMVTLARDLALPLVAATLRDRAHADSYAKAVGMTPWSSRPSSRRPVQLGGESMV